MNDDQHLLEEHRRGLKQSLIEVQVVDALLIGLQKGDVRHKQWALWRVAELLKVTHYAGMRDIEDKGIAP